MMHDGGGNQQQPAETHMTSASMRFLLLENSNCRLRAATFIVAFGENNIEYVRKWTVTLFQHEKIASSALNASPTNREGIRMLSENTAAQHRNNVPNIINSEFVFLHKFICMQCVFCCL